MHASAHAQDQAKAKPRHRPVRNGPSRAHPRRRPGIRGTAGIALVRTHDPCTRAGGAHRPHRSRLEVAVRQINVPGLELALMHERWASKKRPRDLGYGRNRLGLRGGGVPKGTKNDVFVDRRHNLHRRWHGPGAQASAPHLHRRRQAACGCGSALSRNLGKTW